MNVFASCFLFFSRLACWQGVSAAGQQKGLSDSRSRLIMRVFELADEFDDLSES